MTDIRIELTDKQVEEVALRWIKQQGEQGRYKEIIRELLDTARFGHLVWTDVLKYAVNYCARSYCVQKNHIIKDYLE